MTHHIVTRTVPSLQMERVNVDRRNQFYQCWLGFFGFRHLMMGYDVGVHRPQTTRARLWRWVLGG